MPPPEDHVEVTPEHLRAVARELLDVADRLHRDCAELSGGQDAITGASRGFEGMRVAAECEQGWQQSVEALGGKFAAGADTLALNADSYLRTETGVARKFAGG